MEEGGYLDQRNRVLRARVREVGLTLAELLVAVVLLGVVVSAAYRLMVTGGRFFREHSSRIEVADNLRTAVSILTSEVRELDSGGGDLGDISDQSLTYRAMRSTAFVHDRRKRCSGRHERQDSNHQDEYRDKCLDNRETGFRYRPGAVGFASGTAVIHHALR